MAFSCISYYKTLGGEIRHGDGILVGRVTNTRDIIGFHGNTIAETIDSFHSVIDEYLEDCKEKGLNPNKPCSGRFNLRIPPHLHSALLINFDVPLPPTTSSLIFPIR